MTSYPGCITPTEVDPRSVSPTEVNSNSVGWAEKPVCPPTVHPFIVRRLGEIISEQTNYVSNTPLKISLGGMSAQIYYGSGTVLKIRRVI